MPLLSASAKRQPGLHRPVSIGSARDGPIPAPAPRLAAGPSISHSGQIPSRQNPYRQNRWRGSSRKYSKLRDGRRSRDSVAARRRPHPDGLSHSLAGLAISPEAFHRLVRKPASDHSDCSSSELRVSFAQVFLKIQLESIQRLAGNPPAALYPFSG